MNDLEIKVAPDVERKVLAWVIDQITTALQDRAEKEQRWQKWINQYEEKLPVRKSFPWHGCSNISLPVTPIAVETIHAREVNTLFSIRPYIQIKPKKKQADKDKCADLEVFLDKIFQDVLDFYRNGSQWLLEKNKMGTAYLKAYWVYDKKKVRKGNKWEFETTDDAKIDVITIEDLIYPTNAKDIQTCLFVAHRINGISWNYLTSKEKLGIYKNVDKIAGFYRSDTVTKESGADIQRTKEDIEKLIRSSPDVLREYEIHEVYFDYDIDGDGFAEKTVMTLEKNSETLLRWIHHPYNHGKRPFIVNKYMERVGRIDGKGICEMSEYLQEGTNTVVNQTIDNMTIANAKVNKVRKTSKTDIPKDGIYPGCNIYLDDPATDLIPHEMGDVHQSDFALLNLLRDYHERRTKVTDYTLGKESSMMKSRATATGTLALLQESGRHFDLVINNSRLAEVELAYQILELYQQFRPDKVFEVVGRSKEEEAKKNLMQKVKEVLGIDIPNMETVALPPDLGNLRENFEFYCAATSMSVNKEIEKQTNLMLLQQLGGIFQQMLQLLMMMNNPQIQLPPEIAKFTAGVIASYYRMAEDLVRSFEKIDVKSYLPELPEIVKQAYSQGGDVNSLLQQIGGMINGQGSPAGMGGFNPQPGMANIPQAMPGPAGQGMVGPPGPMPNQ